MQQITFNAQRFWEKVDRSGDCWVWTAHRGPQGYGACYVLRDGAKSQMGAHRVSWMIAHGPIPDGMFVCHRCDNPPCVRPDHLFLGSPRDNSQDAAKKGRMASGERHTTRLHPERIARGARLPQTKLTEDDVREIRRELAASTPERHLARRYGVSKSLIWSIKTRRSWRHVE
jgi:hypothetical protein